MTLKIRRLLVTSLLALFCCSLGAGIAEPQIMEIAKEKPKHESVHKPSPYVTHSRNQVERGKLRNPNELAGSMAHGNGTRPEPAGKQEGLQEQEQEKEKDTKPPDGPPGPCEGAIDARKNCNEGRESGEKDTPVPDSLLLMLVVAIGVALAAIPRLLTRLQRPDPWLAGCYFLKDRIRPKT